MTKLKIEQAILAGASGRFDAVANLGPTVAVSAPTRTCQKTGDRPSR